MINRHIKRIILLAVISMMLSITACNEVAADSTNQIDDQKGNYVEDQLLVKFVDGLSAVEIERIIETNNAKIIKKFSHGFTYHLQLKEGVSVKEAQKKFSSLPSVIWAEPNYIKKASRFKSDVIRKK